MTFRGTMQGLAAAAMALAAAVPARAEAPPPAAVTPELVAAATKEGIVVFYTTLDLQVGAMLGKRFEARYPGIRADIERSGAERIFQRIAQEESSGIHAVDVVESTDIAHFLTWTEGGQLAAYVPADVAQWPATDRDAEGRYATSRVTLTVMGYNTRLLKPEAAPKGYRDLLDPIWLGKIVKAHPAYSGNIFVATLAIKNALGWDYFEQLGRQRVMQVQSSTEPPKKLALGERPIMFDGNEYNMLILQDEHAPVEIVYPEEGTPFAQAIAGVMQAAPHANAARLFISYLFSREAQQILVDVAAMRSLHPEVTERPGRRPLAKIKLLKTDPAEQLRSLEEVKLRYARYFGT